MSKRVSGFDAYVCDNVLGNTWLVGATRLHFYVLYPYIYNLSVFCLYLFHREKIVAKIKLYLKKTDFTLYLMMSPLLDEINFIS